MKICEHGDPWFMAAPLKVHSAGPSRRFHGSIAINMGPVVHICQHPVTAQENTWHPAARSYSGFCGGHAP